MAPLKRPLFGRLPNARPRLPDADARSIAGLRPGAITLDGVSEGCRFRRPE